MLSITKQNVWETLRLYLPADGVFIEAGAFNGKDTLSLARHFPHATIHAFEPVPEIYAELKKNTRNIPNINTYPLALSNYTSNATFYIAQHPKHPGKICQAGTLLLPQERLTHSPITYPRTIQVTTITLDEWAQKNHIARVDFMWLDLQGNELAVLKAAPFILKTTSLLYVECNFIQAYEDQPSAQELHAWILSQGFSLKGTDYHEKPTHFFGNHLYYKSFQNENI